MTRPPAVVWLDRDGTLVDDPGYLSDPRALVLLPGAARAVARLNRAGVLAVLVTNQSGVGRGLITKEQLEAVHAELVRQLRVEGAHLDRIMVCPHVPASQLRPGQNPCACRKPSPGLVLQAREILRLDEDTPQVVIGDKEADLQLARACDCQAVLVRTGEGEHTIRDSACPLDQLADHVADDVGAAVDWWLGQLGLADPATSC